MDELGAKFFSQILSDSSASSPPYVEEPSDFQIQLEMLLERYKMQMNINKLTPFYMLLGFLLSSPMSDHFVKFGIKNMYLKVSDQNLKLVVTSDAGGENGPSVKAAVLNSKPDGLADMFVNDNFRLLYKRMTDDLPSITHETLQSCFGSVDLTSLMQPTSANVGRYDVQTDDGIITVPANQDAPYVIGYDKTLLNFKGIIQGEHVPRKDDVTDFLVLQKSMPILDSHLAALSSKDSAEVSSNAEILLNLLMGLFRQYQTPLDLSLTPSNFLAFAFGALHFNFKEKFSLVLEPKFDFLTNDLIGGLQTLLLTSVQDQSRWFNDQVPVEYRMFMEIDRAKFDFGAEVRVSKSVNTKAQNGVIVEMGVSRTISTSGLTVFSFVKIQRKIAPLIKMRNFFEKLIDLRETYFESSSSEAATTWEIKSLFNDLIDIETSLNMKSVEPYLSYQLFGQLMALEKHNSKLVKRYVFEYSDKRFKDRVTSILLKTEADEPGVLVHILEPGANPFDVLTPPPVPVTGVKKLMIVCLDTTMVMGTRPGQSISSFFHDGFSISHLLDVSKVIRPEKGTFTYLSIFSMQPTRGDEFSYLRKAPIRHIDKLLNVMARCEKRVKTAVQYQALLKGYLMNRFESLTPFSNDKSTILMTNDDSTPILMKLEYGDFAELTMKRDLADLRAKYIPHFLSSVAKQNMQTIVLACVHKSRDKYDLFKVGESTTGTKLAMYQSCMVSLRRKRDANFCAVETKEEPAKVVRGKDYITDENLTPKNVDFRNGLLTHLGTVHTFAGALMNFAIAKNLVGSLISGDYKSVAINLGFLSASVAFGQLSKAASKMGQRMLKSDGALAGTLLKSAAPFLARASTGFVIFDLCQQIQSLKAGNADAAAAVAGDGAIVLLDGAQIGLELAEGFELVEGLAAVTGPIISLIGALTFVGLDVYYAAKRVDDIKKYVHLSAWETFAEGFLAFVHADPPKYIQELIEEKKLDDLSEKKDVEIFEKLDVRYFVSPTLRKYGDTVKEMTDNFVDLTTKSPISRKEWPVDLPGYQRLCSSDQKSGDVAKNLFLCKGMIGLQSNNITKSDQSLIKLNFGNDTAVGFPGRSNIFLIGGGLKRVTGGAKSDVFILFGNQSISGTLDGGRGDNILVLANFMPNKNLSVYFYGETASVNALLKTYSMTHLVTRKNAGDTIICDCRLKFLNTQGGNETHLDYIIIPDQNCVYDMDLVINDFIIIWNKESSNGRFVYRVASKPKSVQFMFYGLNSTADHLIQLNDSLSDISNLEYIANFFLISFYNPHEGILIENGNNKSMLITLDQFYIHILQQSILITKEISNENIEQIISLYSTIAANLKAYMIFHDITKNYKIIIGHENHRKNSHIILQNDEKFNTYLIGSSTIDNVFSINGNCDNAMPSVIIYSIRSSDTIDLSQLHFSCKNNYSLYVEPKIEKQDILLEIFKNQHTREILTNITIKDVVQNENIDVLTLRIKVPMNLHLEDDQVILKPIPLNFRNASLIMLSDLDVDGKTTVNILDKKLGGHGDHFYRLKNHLIITNAFDRKIHDSDMVTVFLVNFFEKDTSFDLIFNFVDGRSFSLLEELNLVKTEVLDYTMSFNSAIASLKKY